MTPVAMGRRIPSRVKDPPLPCCSPLTLGAEDGLPEKLGKGKRKGGRGSASAAPLPPSLVLLPSSLEPESDVERSDSYSSSPPVEIEFVKRLLDEELV